MSAFQNRWASCCALAAMACAGLSLILANPATAQTIEARLVAAQGPIPDKTVWETTLAAGVHNAESRAMAVYHVQDGFERRIGYAIAGANRTWDPQAEDMVPPQSLDMFDPCVAYDSTSGDFVLVAIQRAPCGPAQRVYVAIYDWDARQFRDMGSGPGWTPILMPPALECADKTWIVAGDVIPGDPPKQEFYICYMSRFEGRPTPAYLRSTDGGYNWTGDFIRVGGTPIKDWNYPFPAAGSDGAVYAAVNNGSLIAIPPASPPARSIRVLKGTDNFGVVSWDWLYEGAGIPLQISLIDDDLLLTEHLPLGSVGWGTVFTLQQLAFDPATGGLTEPRRLYVAYQDLAAPPASVPDNDVDMFLTKITETPSGWSAAPRLRVNDDNPQEGIADQFLGSIAVHEGPDPAHTRVHLIFYDDRDFPTQTDNPSPASPKFNVYYAFSADSGATFDPQQDLKLFENPDPPQDPPVVDRAVQAPFFIIDYIGIAAQRVEGFGYRLWTSFVGMDATDPNPDKTVIWSSQITWEE